MEYAFSVDFDGIGK